jgi:hypothetical protein
MSGVVHLQVVVDERDVQEVDHLERDVHGDGHCVLGEYVLGRI